jgi:hypothetical protein
MPVPFRDRDDLENLGSAAFLKFEPRAEPSGFRAALFQVNARGEPVEFTYNRVETPSTFLWRAVDVKRAAARQLTVSLLQMCPRAPRLILCLAGEIPAEVFTEDIAVDLPVCRIVRSSNGAAPAPSEMVEQLDHAEGDEPLRLLWHPAPPEDGSSEHALVRALARHGLLVEPFERASAGLDELYGEADPRLS